MQHKITDFDFVFLSFDEPNAEMLYAELLDRVPWCKRVHGVKGFDAAHRACADAADTDLFITVDGDNQMYPEFLDQTVEINDDQLSHAWTWAGRNSVNGLVYGNGGLKLWSKDFIYAMNSHENSDGDAAAVDFCWHDRYHEMFGCFSTSVINASPQQAWRSGFREGVKMCLDRGSRVGPTEFHYRIWHGNINRLCMWSSIGQDVENGIWAMYGARTGCYLATMTDQDHTIISDYQAMEAMWADDVRHHDPIAGCKDIGDRLTRKLGLDITILSPADSRFFKRVFMNPPRPMMSWDQISHFMAIKHV